MSRFLKPEVVRLNLTGGDWITVNKELTAGQQRRAFARTTKRVMAGSPIEIELEKAGLSTIVEYLIDWSFTDHTGKIVPIRDMPADYVMDILNNLDADSFNEITQAIDAHEKTVEEEKNTGHLERVLSDLRICRVMRWTYTEVMELPADVYAVLVDELVKESDKE